MFSKKAIIAAFFLTGGLAWAAVGGSISGTLTDSRGDVLSGVRVIVTNTAQGIQTKTTTDGKGAYRFPTLVVGRYDLRTEDPKFKPQIRRGLAVHVDDKIRVDLVLDSAEDTRP